MTSKKSPNKFRADRSTIVSTDSVVNWIRSPITGKLTQVPGIGEKSQKSLEENGISTTFQLIGKFLSFKGEDVTPNELVDKFFEYINEVMPKNKFKHCVVRAIAEKVDIMFGEGVVFDVKSYPELSGEPSPVQEMDDECDI